MSGIANEIRALEEALLNGDLASNRLLVDSLLASDFEEIESSGRICSREEVVRWLRADNVRGGWVLIDFRVKVLSGDLVLAVYRAGKSPSAASKSSLRSSLWRRTGDGWEMVFHQATKMAADHAS